MNSQGSIAGLITGAMIAFLRLVCLFADGSGAIEPVAR